MLHASVGRLSIFVFVAGSFKFTHTTNNASEDWLEDAWSDLADAGTVCLGFAALQAALNTVLVIIVVGRGGKLRTEPVGEQIWEL